MPVIPIVWSAESLYRDGRDKPGHDVVDVIPGEQSEGRGSTIRRSAMDSLPLR